MRGAGFWAWRRNSGYVIMGGWSFDGAAGELSRGVVDVEDGWGVGGDGDRETSSRSIP